MYSTTYYHIIYQNTHMRSSAQCSSNFGNDCPYDRHDLWICMVLVLWRRCWQFGDPNSQNQQCGDRWNYAWRLGSTSQIWLKHVENNHWNNQAEEVTSWCLWNIEIHPQRVPSSCIPILSSFNIGWLFSSLKLLNSGVVPVLKTNPTCRQTHISFNANQVRW